MIITLPHDHYDPEHLARVIESMQTIGAPTIRAVEVGDAELVALEGSHRLRAAFALGMTPIVQLIPLTDGLASADLGLDWQDDRTIESFVDSAYLRQTLIF